MALCGEYDIWREVRAGFKVGSLGVPTQPRGKQKLVLAGHSPPLA